MVIHTLHLRTRYHEFDDEYINLELNLFENVLNKNFRGMQFIVQAHDRFFFSTFILYGV